MLIRDANCLRASKISDVKGLLNWTLGKNCTTETERKSILHKENSMKKMQKALERHVLGLVNSSISLKTDANLRVYSTDNMKLLKDSEKKDSLVFPMDHSNKSEESCQKHTLRNVFRDHYNSLREHQQRPDDLLNMQGEKMGEIFLRKNQGA